MNVSVVMTCYNSEKYIKEQLDSIFCELPNNAELVICDDCSSDGTINIIKSYQDSRIKLYINEKNLGAVRNLERAISLTSNEIIVISDSDNIWYEGKISKIIPYFENPRISMVMHDAIVVDSNLKPIMESYFVWRKSKPGLIRNIIKNGYGGSMMSFRRTMLKYILNSPKKMPCFYDEWIGMMCEKHGKCVFVNDKLSAWRRHDSVASSLGISNNDGGEKKYLDRVAYFFANIKNRMAKFWLVIVH